MSSLIASSLSDCAVCLVRAESFKIRVIYRVNAVKIVQEIEGYFSLLLKEHNELGSFKDNLAVTKSTPLRSTYVLSGQCPNVAHDVSSSIKIVINRLFSFKVHIYFEQ